MKSNQTDTLFTALNGGAIATISYLIGGIDNLATCYALFMIVDYATGYISARMTDSVTSKRMYNGLAKKGGAISFIILANQLDIIAGSDIGAVRNAMLFFLIGMEGISIKENAQKMGFTAPGFIVDILNKMIGKKPDQNNKQEGE
jgi:toxin secretion/phage lysis holin